jgi:osmotically inducible lipoprotein OsmB
MKTILMLTLIAITLTACANPRDERMGQGALIGGAGGALIGGAATGTAEGAIIGGVAGAAVGAVAADITRPRYRTRCTYSEYYHRRICRKR